jgi:hypothetical protein
MGVLVLVEGGAPALELNALGAREKERVGERDGRGAMGAMRVDVEGTDWQPFTTRGVVLDRADPEERLERGQERAIARRHRDLEPEPQPGTPIGEILALRPDDEAALTGNDSRQNEPYRSPNLIERSYTSVEAMGLEPTNLLHAMQALYQLSYAPRGRFKGISRPALP